MDAAACIQFPVGESTVHFVHPFPPLFSLSPPFASDEEGGGKGLCMSPKGGVRRRGKAPLDLLSVFFPLLPWNQHTHTQREKEREREGRKERKREGEREREREREKERKRLRSTPRVGMSLFT